MACDVHSIAVCKPDTGSYRLWNTLYSIWIDWISSENLVMDYEIYLDHYLVSSVSDSVHE